VYGGYCPWLYCSSAIQHIQLGHACRAYQSHFVQCKTGPRTCSRFVDRYCSLHIGSSSSCSMIGGKKQSHRSSFWCRAVFRNDLLRYFGPYVMLSAITFLCQHVQCSLTLRAYLTRLLYSVRFVGGVGGFNPPTG